MRTAAKDETTLTVRGHSWRTLSRSSSCNLISVTSTVSERLLTRAISHQTQDSTRIYFGIRWPENTTVQVGAKPVIPKFTGVPGSANIRVVCEITNSVVFTKT
jgi:hypothetical protein